MTPLALSATAVVTPTLRLAEGAPPERSTTPTAHSIATTRSCRIEDMPKEIPTAPALAGRMTPRCAETGSQRGACDPSVRLGQLSGDSEALTSAPASLPPRRVLRRERYAVSSASVLAVPQPGHLGLG